MDFYLEFSEFQDGTKTPGKLMTSANWMFFTSSDHDFFFWRGYSRPSFFFRPGVFGMKFWFPDPLHKFGMVFYYDIISVLRFG